MVHAYCRKCMNMKCSGCTMYVLSLSCSLCLCHSATQEVVALPRHRRRRHRYCRCLFQLVCCCLSSCSDVPRLSQLLIDLLFHTLRPTDATPSWNLRCRCRPSVLTINTVTHCIVYTIVALARDGGVLWCAALYRLLMARCERRSKRRNQITKEPRGDGVWRNALTVLCVYLFIYVCIYLSIYYGFPLGTAAKKSAVFLIQMATN